MRMASIMILCNAVYHSTPEKVAARWDGCEYHIFIQGSTGTVVILIT